MLNTNIRPSIVLRALPLHTRQIAIWKQSAIYHPNASMYWIIMCIIAKCRQMARLSLQVSFQRVIFIRIKYPLLLQHLESVWCQRSWDYPKWDSLSGDHTCFLRTFYYCHPIKYVHSFFSINFIVLQVAAKWQSNKKIYIFLTFFVDLATFVIMFSWCQVQLFCYCAKNDL